MEGGKEKVKNLLHNVLPVFCKESQNGMLYRIAPQDTF